VGGATASQGQAARQTKGCTSLKIDFVATGEARVQLYLINCEQCNGATRTYSTEKLY